GITKYLSPSPKPLLSSSASSLDEGAPSGGGPSAERGAAPAGHGSHRDCREASIRLVHRHYDRLPQAGPKDGASALIRIREGVRCGAVRTGAPMSGVRPRRRRGARVSRFKIAAAGADGSAHFRFGLTAGAAGVLVKRPPPPRGRP